MRVWDANSAALVRCLSGHTARVWDVCAGGEGIVFSASADTSVKVGRVLSLHHGHDFTTLVCKHGY